MSPSSESTVRLPADLHARPAGQLSQAAARFLSSVVLVTETREVDARSVLLVMGLGATRGTDVTVRASGEDAEEAVRTVASILASLLPEPQAAPSSG
jgi:phosphotransferase system HPr (HPr) family protein